MIVEMQDDGQRVIVPPGVFHPQVGFYQNYCVPGCHSYPTTPEDARFELLLRALEWFVENTIDNRFNGCLP